MKRNYKHHDNNNSRSAEYVTVMKKQLMTMLVIPTIRDLDLVTLKRNSVFFVQDVREHLHGNSFLAEGIGGCGLNGDTCCVHFW